METSVQLAASTWPCNTQLTLQQTELLTGLVRLLGAGVTAVLLALLHAKFVQL
jgi:hypothetical protein